MAELPKINSLLEVAVTPEATLPSRIEDVDGDLLTIAAPTGIGDLEVPDADAVLEIAWIANRGRYVMRVTMVGRTREQPPRWFVRASGRPRLKSRRRYVRGGGGEPILIATTERDPAGSWSGRVIDVSEGGVRCRIEQTDLVPSEPVTVRIELPDGPVVLTGSVLALREPMEPDAKGVDVVAVYEAPRVEGDRLRRHVLAWELAERRRQRGRGSRLVGALTRHTARHDRSRQQGRGETLRS